MAVFEYTAKDENGVKFIGTYIDVDSVEMLQDELAKLGYKLLGAKRKKTAAKRVRKIKRNEVMVFAYNFAGMCAAGLPIAKSLEAMEEQTENETFKGIISDVRQSIERGSTLRAAFEKYRAIFSDFFLGMLEAGESSGKLSRTLELSAIYLEKQGVVNQKVRSAFIYPIIVAIMCFIVVASLMTFVIPVFTKLYKQLRVPLPLLTQILVDTSDVARHYWWAILIIIAGAILLLRRYWKSPYVRTAWDSFKFKIPVFAKVNRAVAVSNFIRTFAMLVGAGVPLVRALEVASVVTNNSKIYGIAKDLQQSIEAGNPVASSLKKHGIFPPMIIQLAASGEEAGMLSDMLNKGVDFLDKDIEMMVNALIVKLEPTLTVIMGSIVGVVLIGVYLPMFDYMSHLK